jgi:hypothetical protein
MLHVLCGEYQNSPSIKKDGKWYRMLDSSVNSFPDLVYQYIVNVLINPIAHKEKKKKERKKARKEKIDSFYHPLHSNNT